MKKEKSISVGTSLKYANWWIQIFLFPVSRFSRVAWYLAMASDLLPAYQRCFLSSPTRTPGWASTTSWLRWTASRCWAAPTTPPWRRWGTPCRRRATPGEPSSWWCCAPPARYHARKIETQKSKKSKIKKCQVEFVTRRVLQHVVIWNPTQATLTDVIDILRSQKRLKKNKKNK